MLEFDIITDVSLTCRKDRDVFDERNGFRMIVYGLDYHENCMLLKEIQKIIHFNLELIQYPDGNIFNESVGLHDFLDFITGFKTHLADHNLEKSISYEYVSKEYLKSGLKKDLDFFESFTKCALLEGAKTIQFKTI